MTAVLKDLYIEQGATFERSFQWRMPGATVDGVVQPGDPKDLTGWTVRMQVRKNQQSDVLIDASTDNAKIILGVDPDTPEMTPDPTNGWVTMSFADEDTDALTEKTAKYDLEAEDPTGRVFRLLQGAVTVSANITQVPTDPVVNQ